MSLSGYMTRHRVGLKRSFYTALGITAGAAASLYAQRQLALPPDEERAGPPPAVLRAKVYCCALPAASCVAFTVAKRIHVVLFHKQLQQQLARVAAADRAFVPPHQRRSQLGSIHTPHV